MRNVLFQIGPLKIQGYGTMIAIGILAAYYVAEYCAKKMKMEYERIISITIYCAIAGILGAKALYYLTSIREIIKDPSILLNVTQGFVVYGGIIAGILAGYLYAAKNQLDFFKYFDLVMPSIALAQGFGRIGCLLAGCCYGLETDSWFGITFRHSLSAPNNVSLIPTQILSSVLNFAHFFLLLYFAKRKKAEGQVAALYLICYSAGRFFIEFLRGDLERGSIAGISTSQFISIFLFIFGLLLMFLRTKHGNGAEAAVVSEEEEADVEVLVSTEGDADLEARIAAERDPAVIALVSKEGDADVEELDSEEGDADLEETASEEEDLDLEAVVSEEEAFELHEQDISEEQED